VVRGRGGFVVSLESGSPIESALVIAAVGAAPNVAWLESSGLPLSNGVDVDENLIAAQDVYAIGDVARFRYHGVGGLETARIEHWQNAGDHATALATSLVQGTPVNLQSLVSYFWSDQYGKKIQMLGHPSPSDDVEIVEGATDAGRWLALYARGGVVTGALALSHPRALMLCRSLIADEVSLDTALALRPWAR
jgi:3-phenylpropionate/trans-cinnamate dioxygenase ferredoxin reductase subunit